MCVLACNRIRTKTVTHFLALMHEYNLTTTAHKLVFFDHTDMQLGEGVGQAKQTRMKFGACILSSEISQTWVIVKMDESPMLVIRIPFACYG